MATRALIKECLFIADLNGLNPQKDNLFNKIHILSSIILTAGFGIECILAVLHEWKGLVSLDSIAMFIAAYQTLSKLCIVIIHRDKLNEVINCMHKHYWPLNKCGKELELEFQYIISFIKRIMITTVIMATITISIYLITPLFDEERRLPFVTLHPRNITISPNYEVAYIIQVVSLIKVMPASVLAFDFCFISLITYIVFELRMIRREIKTLEIDNNASENETIILQQLKAIGKHHSMVLRCVQYMKDIYSIVLLSQFLTVMFLICMGLVFIIVSGFLLPVYDLIKVLGYSITFAGLLFLYCFAGSCLTFESEEVANAAFNSQWWIKTQPKVRRNISLIIQRSHKVETLSAGGMINLNLETFSNVVKTSLSFFMLGQTLFTNKQVRI